MSQPVAIAASGKDVIERITDVTEETLDDTQYPFEEYFDIEGTVNVIIQNQHQFVALQFPDSLLWASTRVQSILLQKCNEIDEKIRICVLADTSYGNCCVDEIAAQHFLSTLIVHYGHACLSTRSNRLSVYYVFGKKKPQLETLISNHSDQILANKQTPDDQPQKVYVFYDPIYHHQINEIKEAFNKTDQKYEICEIYKLSSESLKKTSTSSKKSCCSNTECCESNEQEYEKEDEENTEKADLISFLSLPSEEELTLNFTTTTQLNEEGYILIFGRKVSKDILLDINRAFIWIGESSSITLRNLKMRFNTCKFFIWEPEKLKLSEERVINRSLMQRYGLVQKAKEAELIGIVVGTLAVSRYLNMVEYVKDIIKKAGKNYYLYVIGKINPYKLANFPEVDIFVLIACHENSAIDSREFYRPVITPFELQLALVRFVLSIVL